MPRFFASRAASRRVPAEEYGEDMVTPVTLAAPSASTAMQATSAESIPPDRPSTTWREPVLPHVVAQPTTRAR